MNLPQLGAIRQLLLREAAQRQPAELSACQVVDEGVLHAIWSCSLMSRSALQVQVSRLSSKVALSDIVVSVRVSPKVAMERLARRGSHRLLSVPREVALSYLQGQESTLDLLEARAIRDAHLVKLTPAADEGPVSLAEAVCSSLLGAAGMPPG